MEELKQLLRTVERRTNPDEPNFEIVEIDGGDFNAILALANLLRVENEALRKAATAAKQHLIHELEEPGRSVFWQLVEALKLNPNTSNNGEANG